MFTVINVANIFLLWPFMTALICVANSWCNKEIGNLNGFVTIAVLFIASCVQGCKVINLFPQVSLLLMCAAVIGLLIFSVAHLLLNSKGIVQYTLFILYSLIVGCVGYVLLDLYQLRYMLP